MDDDRCTESIKALARIKQSYGVPAELGARVAMTHQGRKRRGTVVGAIETRIRVVVDGRPLVYSFSPDELRFTGRPFYREAETHEQR